MDNFNTELGYPYGVFQGNTVPDLLDDIQSCGRSVDHDEWQTNITVALRAALSDHVDVTEHLLEQLVDTISDECGPNFEEERFECQSGDQAFYQTYLGGAPLVYVTSSEWITWCCLCSPCVPGAGDLDTPIEPPGIAALCMCPDDMQLMADAHGVSYTLKNIKTGAIVKVTPKEEE